jgi:site-specific DNA recombinase
MKICIYVRVSTEKQELQSQIDACKRFCEYKGFEIAKIYYDIGSGADFFKRPQLNEMLKDLRAYKYNGVVVFRFDRLGRNAIECVKFFDEMETKGIEIFSLNESLDTSTAIGRAIRDIILRLAQLERESISEATKQRLQALKNLGKKLGRPKGSKDNPRKPRKKAGYYGNQNRSKKGPLKNITKA